MAQKTCVLFIQGGGKGAHAEDAVLSESLKQALGAEYDVRFPQMPDEEIPNVQKWKPAIASELSRVSGKVIVVAHSLGGSILLKYLAEKKVETLIAGLFLLAAPAWDGDRWAFDDLKLPYDISTKLASIPRIFLYHCRDDEVVPFDHLALQQARIPKAIVRIVDSGGHQFCNGLKDVAVEIESKGV